MATTILVELSNNDVVWLAWAAGMAAGAGNEDAGKSLSAILTRLQVVELPAEADTSTWEDDGGAVSDEPADDGPALAEVRSIDPQFPPPVPAPPISRQEDFGAGRPPGV